MKTEKNITVSIKLELDLQEFVWLYNMAMGTSYSLANTPVLALNQSNNPVMDRLYKLKEELVEIGLMKEGCVLHPPAAPMKPSKY